MYMWPNLTLRDDEPQREPCRRARPLSALPVSIFEDAVPEGLAGLGDAVVHGSNIGSTDGEPTLPYSRIFY